MMVWVHRIVIFFVIGLVSGCSKQSKFADKPARTARATSEEATANRESQNNDPRIADAQRLIGELKKSLMTALGGAMQSGLEQAVTACQLKAPKIADKLSQANMEVGRTSHKLRNLNNAPESWMKPFLSEYLKLGEPEPNSFRTAKLNDGSLGYVEPIYVKPLCLNCHGESIPPAVTEELNKRYPEDDATGFKTGDFRGLFWAKLPPNKSP